MRQSGKSFGRPDTTDNSLPSGQQPWRNVHEHRRLEEQRQQALRIQSGNEAQRFGWHPASGITSVDYMANIRAQQAEQIAQRLGGTRQQLQHDIAPGDYLANPGYNPQASSSSAPFVSRNNAFSINPPAPYGNFSHISSQISDTNLSFPMPASTELASGMTSLGITPKDALQYDTRASNAPQSNTQNRITAMEADLDVSNATGDPEAIVAHAEHNRATGYTGQEVRRAAMKAALDSAIASGDPEQIAAARAEHNKAMGHTDRATTKAALDSAIASGDPVLIAAARAEHDRKMGYAAKKTVRTALDSATASGDPVLIAAARAELARTAGYSAKQARRAASKATLVAAIASDDPVLIAASRAKHDKAMGRTAQRASKANLDTARAIGDPVLIEVARAERDRATGYTGKKARRAAARAALDAAYATRDPALIAAARAKYDKAMGRATKKASKAALDAVRTTDDSDAIEAAHTEHNRPYFDSSNTSLGAGAPMEATTPTTGETSTRHDVPLAFASQVNAPSSSQQLSSQTDMGSQTIASIADTYMNPVKTPGIKHWPPLTDEQITQVRAKLKDRKKRGKMTQIEYDSATCALGSTRRKI